MADPLSVVLIAGAAGGAAGKFIEKTYDAGERWLTSYYKDHQESLQRQAKENSNAFLEKLARKVQQLENECSTNSEVINGALGDPHFGALIQKALISSAQTKSDEKHSVLAQLVSNRMKSESDSAYAMAS